jgi:hypothetical protein
LRTWALVTKDLALFFPAEPPKVGYVNFLSLSFLIYKKLYNYPCLTGLWKGLRELK